ncbi:hypothetical protein APY04_2605 [Hyphomicrobium sulfonivorans]|uniref:L,D-TPase catalytic domain-containing protein n=1 Tax=Hyphomicrobium sulfonivorans TaxID=121290 RepID=A0A109BC07_HYPSL|nr:L,D-transpeptidase family protein [Hyphomicrobium sulfonivorans]KWT66018.1 hypothetical protein APY04_2605 [Hyphomicrobium sulfonivorans]
MIRLAFLMLAAGSALLAAAPMAIAAPSMSEEAIATDPAITPPMLPPTDTNPVASAVRSKLNALPVEGSAEELKERSVLSDVYAARRDVPIWLTEGGLTDRGAALGAEILKAADWGLNPADFHLPVIPPPSKLDAATLGKADVEISKALLKYARYARGGRITAPSILLNSNLDRRPQFLDAETVFRDAIATPDPAEYLRSLHPQHPQFQKLRVLYVANRTKPLGKRILANMEQWRWMPADLGQMHVMANVPEFIIRVFKDGDAVHTERIVVGETDKQTTIYTRPLRAVVFKPMWRVPESIKVKELQPDLRRNASLFRQHGLQLETKDGAPIDYRTIDWHTADIRKYEVVQPPGPKNVMGVVKFTFPSQHTIFMHDTLDKWMFAQKVRTLSHGCLRLRNPMKMAEVILAEDKGWDADTVQSKMKTGPRDQEIMLEKRIPMHMVYFTTWVDSDGKLQTFGDIYGHEKRISLALDGKWDEIDVGRDHLAPVGAAPASSDGFSTSSNRPTTQQRQKKQSTTIVDMVGNALGGGF